ncbi:MAG: Protoheme IX farnesyltransferase, mitochondrial [Candelina mexicana]|nr:MAG: Protoheme IX farnesyltransferase, mitochondrial [Candelina mexicana]
MINRSSPLPSRESVCLRCLRRLSRPPCGSGQRPFSTTAQHRESVLANQRRRGPLRKEYFLANGFLNGGRRSVGRGVLSYSVPVAEERASERSDTPYQTHAAPSFETSRYEVLPRQLSRRRRGGLRHDEVIASAATAGADSVIPPDASSRLTTISSALPNNSLRRLFTTYLSLSKPRLSFLIVLTTSTAYSLYPVPALLLPSTTASPSLSALTLLFLTTGTALSCGSANTLNMLLEPTYDAKMSRTRNRPLVRKLITPRAALIFAVFTGSAGLGALYYGVNPTVAFLSGLNIFLYVGVYTPLKRISVANTWVGALVGGIPPFMGWAAAAGQSATGDGWQELLLGEENIGGWLLAGLLFTWQFPHFNALSWSIRDEYRNAGYRMLCWVNPRANGRVAFRYSLLCFPICVGLWWVGVTDQGFLVTSSVVNAWMAREAYKFWRLEGQKGSARGLFWASVWHLPVVMCLCMAHKQGLWQGVWRSVMGTGDGEYGEQEIWDDEMEAQGPPGGELKAIVL